MNSIEREIKNTDGTRETLVITSSDNYKINLKGTYKLANYRSKKENKFVNRFKNSILGAEIGVRAEGFSNMSILATLIAVGAVCIMYILFRI